MSARGPSAHRLGLTGDVRIDLFAFVFALGTILHELEFAREVIVVGPIFEYMERWGRAVPTIGWSSRVGVTLHAANVAISLLLLVVPWRRAGLSLLAVTLFLSQLASPNRLASHTALMMGGLLVVLALSVAEWFQRLATRDRTAPGPTDWYGWTLMGLAWICVLTYWFAFYYKLNESWLSPRSAGLIFLTRPVAPILDVVGVSAAIADAVLAPTAIYGTFAMELVLPVLLSWRRTRWLGFLAGLGFHLIMLAGAVSDFPVLILAFYPAFLTLDEARALLAVLARPTVGRLGGTVFLGIYGMWILQHIPRTSWVWESTFAAFVRDINAVLAHVSLVGTLYVAWGVAGGLLWRPAPMRVRGVPATGSVSGPVGEPAVRGRRGVSPTSVTACAVVLLVGVAFAGNQAAPFVGLPAAGALIMYSGIGSDFGNHFFRPGFQLSQAYDYVSIAQFEPEDSELPEARGFHTFLQDLARKNQAYELHLNFVRYHMSRICAASSGAPVRLTLRTRKGDVRELENVCSERAMLWYAPIPIGQECRPRCYGALVRWARQ